MRKPYIIYRRHPAASRACWYIGFWSAEEGRYATRKAATALIAELGPRGAHLARSAHTRAAAEEAAKLYSPVAATDSIAVYLAWRHWYVSMMRGTLSDAALRQLTRHQSQEMLDRYTSVTDEQRRAAARIAGRILEKG